MKIIEEAKDTDYLFVLNSEEVKNLKKHTLEGELLGYDWQQIDGKLVQYPYLNKNFKLRMQKKDEKIVAGGAACNSNRDLFWICNAAYEGLSEKGHIELRFDDGGNKIYLWNHEKDPNHYFGMKDNLKRLNKI